MAAYDAHQISPSPYFLSFNTQSLAIFSPSALFGSSVHIFRTTYSIHIFPLRFSSALLSILYLLYVFYSYFSFIYVNILHFYWLLWAFHSSFSLTSFAFFFHSSIQFAVLYSLGHLRFPSLSHSLTSHILSTANLAFSVLFPFTHSSIMRILCLMHTHRLLYTCCL